MRTVASVILLCLAAAAMSFVPVTASADVPQILVPVAADAHVKVAHKRANYGANANLVVDGRRATRTVALLRVTNPADATAGTLQLMVRPATSLGRGVQVYLAGNNWREPGVTWKKRPERGRTLVGTSDALLAGVTEVIDLDLSGVVPGKKVSLRIRTSARSRLVFASTEGDPTSRPMIQYTPTRGPNPIPTPTGTLVGACPTVGTPSSSVISKFGTGASVRVFNPDGFASAVSRPTGASKVHVSWKPTIGSTITDTQIVTAFANLWDGDLVEVWHESDVKYRKGDDLASMLAMKNQFHDRVVALRDAGRIAHVLTVNTWSGWSVDSTSTVNPANLHARADVLGVDMDGIPANDNFYPFAERQMGAKFVAAYRAGGYTGWTVPEFSMPAVASDPTNQKRIAWFQSEVARISEGVPASGIPAPLMIAWFDTDGSTILNTALSTSNEIAAWSAAVDNNLGATKVRLDRPLLVGP